MAELEITNDGEIKVAYDVVGRIVWVAPYAGNGLVGNYFDEYQYDGYDCQIDSLEEQISLLKKANSDLVAQILTLENELKSERKNSK